MKRILPFLIGFLAVGCGPFTNVPAQIHVKSIDPAATTVTYTKDSSGNVTASFKNPLITFEGEPGSPGAVFTSAVITYYDDKHAVIKSDPDQLTLEVHIDVGTSNYRDPQDTKKILLGTGSWTAPVVNQDVIDYGNKGTSSAITAVIDLTGKDYSWFPIVRTIAIPIAFAGPAN